MARVVLASQFAHELRRMAAALPEAIERGMRDAGLQLQGRLVQREIAATTPYKPVDQGQYKAGWTSFEVPGGLAVGNKSKQALWIERGRQPGPVPLAPLYEWVRRHRDMWSAKAKQQVSALKTEPVRAGRGANAVRKVEVRQHNRRARQLERTVGQDSAITEVARAVQAAIRARGIRPRWVLRRAIDDLRPVVPRAIKRALRELKP